MPQNPKNVVNLADRESCINFLKFFIAGGVSAVFSRTITAPFERVKLILQLQEVSKQINKDKQYKGIFHTLSRITIEQGLFSLWRGNLANVVRYFPNSGLNLAFMNVYQKLLLKKGDNENFWRHLRINLTAGGLAGVSASTIIYPLDYVRTRLAVDIGRNLSDRQFTGIWDCLVKTVQQSGPAGLYQGYMASVFGILICRAIFFGGFESAKNIYDPENTPFTVMFGIAHMVALLSTYVSYPFDTVRRRMMMQSRKGGEDLVLYKNTFDCWKKIAKVEGLAAFYKGAFTNILLSSGGAFILVMNDTLVKTFDWFF